MSCPRSNLISAFHDGELAPSQAAELRPHLADCADCRAELEQLEQLSTQIRSARLTEPSTEAVERWSAEFSDARDRSVRRLASWMTAAAAMILVGVGLFTLLHDRPTTAASAPVLLSPVDTVALVPEGEVAASPTVVAAEWMATDLSGGLADARRWP